MSDGIQKFAGNQMRSILRQITQNRFAGILTGFGTTAIIQSSSATTVMIVSFVNAGLLSLRQAIGVIMGANIGTTVTAFLLLAFGFGKFSISDYSLPIIAIGIPLFFINRSKIKSFGEFLIGFAILFMGLDALKELMSFIKEDPSFLQNFIQPLDQFGFGSVIIFVLIGTLLTVIVQSSSAAMAITLSLCGGANGLSFELAAKLGFKEAARLAKSVIMEPIMKLEVLTPEENMGDVIGDLNRRRGMIKSQEPNATGIRIKADAPLSEMFGYIGHLRTMTSGRGQFSMEFSHYSATPKNVAETVIKEAKEREEAKKK